MASPFGSETDPKAFMCDDIRWDAIGGAAPVLPGTLRSTRASTSFINLGQRSWPLISDNKPAALVGWASACPVGVVPPPGEPGFTREFSVLGRNHFGSTVFHIRYRLAVQAGANGLFIARFHTEPREASIAFGWKVNLTVSTQAPLECGDGGAATAVLPVKLDLVVDTKIKRSQASQSYLVVPKGAFPV
jgi:hypothetical protein